MQVAGLRASRSSFKPPPRFNEVLDLIKTGHFGWQDYFAPLVDTLETTDHYLVANDFQGYIDIQVCPNLLPAPRGVLLNSAASCVPPVSPLQPLHSHGRL